MFTRPGDYSLSKRRKPCKIQVLKVFITFHGVNKAVKYYFQIAIIAPGLFSGCCLCATEEEFMFSGTSVYSYVASH